MPLPSFLTSTFTSICRLFETFPLTSLLLSSGLFFLSLVFLFLLPTSTDVRVFPYNLFLPFIKVCHCRLCFPNIFSPQCSALSLLLQCFADVACVSCQYGAKLSAQLDHIHLLFSYQDLQDVAEYMLFFFGEYRWRLPSCCFELSSLLYDCSQMTWTQHLFSKWWLPHFFH